MEKRITRKDMFNVIKEVCKDRTDIVDFCDKEIAKIEKKSANSGTAKNREENIKIGNMLIEELAKLKVATITELLTQSETVRNFRFGENNEKFLTNQKITAIFTMLKDENKIVRIEDGKKVLFKVVN